MVILSRLIQDSDLAEDEKRKAHHSALRAAPDEADILRTVFEIPESVKYVGEIFRGAHVRICDKGARYDDWKSLPTADTRSSSHQSDGDQYHVDGPLTHTILFGKFAGWTWLQLEGHPIYDVVSFFGHMIDYINYKRSGDNQGPYGSSPHAENRNPSSSRRRSPTFPSTVPAGSSRKPANPASPAAPPSASAGPRLGAALYCYPLAGGEGAGFGAGRRP